MDEIDTVLLAHADHPDVAEYLRLREDGQAIIRERWGPPTPEAMEQVRIAWGLDDSTEGYRAHAEEIVERLTQPSEFTDRLTAAHDAALAWALAVAPDINETKLRAALYRQSILLRVMRSDPRPVSEVMIQLALAAVKGPIHDR